MDATGTASAAKSGLSKVLRRRFSFTFSRFNRRYHLENVTSFPRPSPLLSEHFRIETIVLFHNNFVKVARTRLTSSHLGTRQSDITGTIYVERCATAEDAVAGRARVMI